MLFKSAIRSLQHRKWYSVLSILGLSVGFSAFIIIGLFIKYELSWDTFNENYENIYRIQTYKTNSDTYWMQSAPTVIDHIRNKYDDIENLGIAFTDPLTYISTSRNEAPIEAEGQYADQGYLDIFTFDFIYGVAAVALREPNSVIISSSTSKKLYGTDNPVGNILWFDKKHQLKITGVYTDLPKNSHLQPDFIISIESIKGFWNNPHVFENWDFTVFYTYILTREGADIGHLNGEIRDLLKDKVLTDYRQLYLRPLSKLYVASTNNNYLVVIYLLGIMSVLVLLLASINFMNMVSATGSLRAKEIGIKKVVGSNRIHLMMQIFLESLFITISSFFICLIFVELVLNKFNNLTDRSISLDLLLADHYYLIIIAILLLVSAISSIYPSWLITSVKSIDLFKQNVFTQKRRGISHKKYLVGFQFAVSIGLITVSVLMSKQIWYMRTKDLGFERENLAFAEMHSNYSGVSLDKMKNLIEEHPSIRMVGFSLGVPMNSSRYTNTRMINWEGGSREEYVEVGHYWVSHEYAKTLGLKIVNGRDFSRDYPSDVKNGCLINETAAKAFGWENPIGKYINDRQQQVIGVFRDIHFHDIYNRIKPLVLTVRDDESIIDGWTYINMKIESGSFREVNKYVQSLLIEYFPENSFRIMTFNDHFAQDQHFAIFDTTFTIFAFLAIVAILLSVFGVIGLVNHSLNQRTKEIAIRKISGCTSWSIFQSLTLEYLLIIMVSAAFGSAGAYLAFNNITLHYPVPQGLMDYLIGIVLALFITLLSIVYKTLKESVRNPVEALRYE